MFASLVLVSVVATAIVAVNANYLKDAPVASGLCDASVKSLSGEL
jgi:hypothetical protein